METRKFHFQRPMTIIQNRIEWRRQVAASSRVANRPEFFGTVPNSAAVSRVPNGSIRDRLMSRISLRKQLCQQESLFPVFSLWSLPVINCYRAS